MKIKYLILLFIATSAYSSGIWAKTSLSKKQQGYILQEMAVLMAEYQLPSLSLAIGMNNKIVFADALGYSEIKSKVPADKNTQYSVGSIAKSMTGLAIAKFVDENKIVLDKKVSEYLNSPTYTRLFSVRQLASHIAGIPHETVERQIAEFRDIRDYRNPLDAFWTFSSHSLLFKPGSEFKYSSSGYILLSGLIQQVAGMNYVEYLDSTLFKTYSMMGTELDTSFAGKNKEAIYYSEFKSDGGYEKSWEKRDRSFLFGGGGFISTPGDLVKMAQATYDDVFLSKTLKLELRKPTRLSNGDVNSQNYSIGFRVGHIEIQDQTFTTLHHGGIMGKAANAYFLVIPDCKASIAFATNFVPDNFWKIRPKLTGILGSLLIENQCEP